MRSKARPGDHGLSGPVYFAGGIWNQIEQQIPTCTKAI
jgi:hypothetical protein